ncbi:MAG TPA: hypothetical protein DCR94_06610 [Firmicutes bacterium]|nr:hypothetical protein [Bacillota bacterium]
MILIIVVIVIFVLFLGLVAFLRIFSKNEDHDGRDEYESSKFGEVGEKYVANELNEIVKKYGGYLYNNFCFEDEKGFSSEIDHILITKGGVFVIETKTNKGKIIGNEDDKFWICIKKDYQDDKQFKNPIIQNQGHINHLRRMLNHNPPKMISMVIFPIADISSINSPIVHDMGSALSFIADLTINSKKSSDFAKNINERIKKIQDNYSISKKRHLQNIHDHF